ncbi:L-type lectin-domain containing receptor kinase IX.1-like [Malus sylvestris]|uniref:L-type lectin-domain containing receptor kinase IX.1-like n=1 Tax=Malus domestica TaxID=3750 RepID=UPI0021AC2F1F|nr:L-type lectin-domain containing receptor kinase IX.1-like [Malus sylvestris]
MIFHYSNKRYIFSVFFLSIHLFAPFANPLSFSFPQFDSGSNKIHYAGDARLSYTKIELNQQLGSPCVGRATYSEPLQLWDSTTSLLADFATHFTFTVNFGDSPYIGDGFAFFLAPVGYPIPPNSHSGNLGLFNKTTNLVVSQNHIVAVEFDNFKNEQWDPPAPHVGINVNQISSTVSGSWDLRSKSENVGHAWITYNASSNNLSVFWTYDVSPVFVDNSSLFSVIDLRKVLPEQVTIGFSASAVQKQRHVIRSWEFNSSLDSVEVAIKQKEKKTKKAILITAVVASSFVLMLGVAICCFCLLVVKKRRNRNDGHAKHSNDLNLEKLAFPKRFSYKELVAATNGFEDDRKLGQGGSGQVYEGILQDLGCAVAVKRIFAKIKNHEKIFTTEVKIICRLMHKNLVQFIGWCHEEGKCLLVYSYMPNGSLDMHLFGPRTTLQWSFRYKIALGLASALHYLHEDAERCVLHRDIKSANVLLDNDFSAKLGDFGIAKLVDPLVRTQTTGVVGTYGYMAPEYAKGGKATKESDMFSFGVVALELACGRRTYEDAGYHEPLFSWAWKLYLAGNLLDVADERLCMNFNRNEMECLLVVGLWCTRPDHEERPKAGQVVKVLQLEAPLPELPQNMHEYLLPQRPQQAFSSHGSITDTFEDAGR